MEAFDAVLSRDFVWDDNRLKHIIRTGVGRDAELVSQAVCRDYPKKFLLKQHAIRVLGNLKPHRDFHVKFDQLFRGSLVDSRDRLQFDMTPANLHLEIIWITVGT